MISYLVEAKLERNKMIVKPPQFNPERTSPAFEAPEVKPELSAGEVEAKHHELWESGDKIGALEAVLGRYVNASEVSDNPILQTVMMTRSAAEAYGAALMIKTIEESADQKAE